MEERHLWPGLRLGLRARITLAVTLVTAALSIAVWLTTVTVARQTLLDSREEAVTRRAQSNSAVISGRDLAETEASEVQTTLSSLSDTERPSVVWNGGIDDVSLDPRYTADDIPPEMLRLALEDGEGSIMRFQFRDEPLVAVAVPISNQQAAYIEVSSLEGVQTAVQTISTALLAAVIASALAAGFLGYWLSRYTIRPLTRVTDAAEAVALGQLDTRMNYSEYEHDPDLAPLVANFNMMVQTLEERIAADARFASDVSHELRSPLTTLKASLQVLENNREALPERAQQAFDLLDSDVERFTQLVEDLLEISRFDAGAVRLELDDVALVPMVRATINNLTHGTVEVLHEPQLEDTIIACDKRRLARILANFVNNAEKYADGATHVSVERHQGGPDGEPSVRVAVEDSGPGVPEELREKIFDRFNRGDQGGSRGADVGVGLGLSLAAEHARLQAGNVWVEDRTDGGSGARFVVELPLLEVHPSELEEDLSAATPEATSNLTLTGEHKAIQMSNPGEFP